jgi:hypothetical protein
VSAENAEYRVEALWRTDGRLSNADVERLAEAAEAARRSGRGHEAGPEGVGLSPTGSTVRATCLPAGSRAGDEWAHRGVSAGVVVGVALIPRRRPARVS